MKSTEIIITLIILIIGAITLGIIVNGELPKETIIIKKYTQQSVQMEPTIIEINNTIIQKESYVPTADCVKIKEVGKDEFTMHCKEK